MSKTASTLVAFALLVLPKLALATPYEIDPAHSAAQFSVRHLAVSTVRGEFGKVTGTLQLDDKDVTKSTVEALIDVASITTRNDKRDEHLKSPDFFDIAKYPAITFKSKKVTRDGADKLKVAGDLSLHGVTKEVVLSVDGPAKPLKDPWGNTKSGATATTKISRRDFGLTWNKALDTGGVVVGDEVSITIDVELQQKK